MGDITIFKRHELKYLLSDRQREGFERDIQKEMIPDSHGESTVCNVYYDTDDFRIIRHSLEKPVYKEKLRLRSYGKVDENRNVFLELKKKYMGIVYKRRIHIRERDAFDFLSGRIDNPNHSQIGREIDYFISSYPGLEAKVYLCYDRSAYFSSTDNSLRITFDRNIRYRTSELRLSFEPAGKRIISPEESLLEIKCADSMPLWLVKLLEKYDIKKVSFSKYGTAYTQMLTERLNEHRGIFR